MRKLAPFMAGILLTACGVEPGPTDPRRDPPSDTTVTTQTDHELTLPAIHVSSHEVTVYANREGAEASYLTELHYALGDGYPSHVTLAPDGGYVLSKECHTEFGAVVWTSIADVQGSAAKVALDAGHLSIELLDEGSVSVLLQGTIDGQDCTSASGLPETSIPLLHRVVLHAHRVEGFVVEQFHQQLAGCWDRMVLPSAAPLWAPTAAPLAAGRVRFDAVNAPAPVAITLRSKGTLTPIGEAQLSAGAGAVSVSLATTLPVEGLQSFDVVGPDALTSVDAALYLSKAASKGNVSLPIEEGMSYEIWFPEMGNDVVVQVQSATTSLGKLCANVPGTWFSATSSTPDQCAANPGGAVSLSDSFVPVAAILSPGECRLEVKIPDTNLAWATRFTTTL